MKLILSLGVLSMALLQASAAFAICKATPEIVNFRVHGDHEDDYGYYRCRVTVSGEEKIFSSREVNEKQCHDFCKYFEGEWSYFSRSNNDPFINALNSFIREAR